MLTVPIAGLDPAVLTPYDHGLKPLNAPQAQKPAGSLGTAAVSGVLIWTVLDTTCENTCLNSKEYGSLLRSSYCSTGSQYDVPLFWEE